MEKGGWNHRRPIRQVAKEAANLPLNFEPGSKIGYSNIGVDVCAAIVEVVSGKPLIVVFALKLMERFKKIWIKKLSACARMSAGTP